MDVMKVVMEWLLSSCCGGGLGAVLGQTHRGIVSILTWNEDYHPDPVGPIHLGFMKIIAEPFPDHFCCYLGTGTEVREDKLDLARPAPAKTAWRGQQRQLRQLQSANASYSKKYLLMWTLHWI